MIQLHLFKSICQVHFPFHINSFKMENIQCTDNIHPPCMEKMEKKRTCIVYLKLIQNDLWASSVTEERKSICFISIFFLLHLSYEISQQYQPKAMCLQCKTAEVFLQAQPHLQYIYRNLIKTSLIYSCYCYLTVIAIYNNWIKKGTNQCNCDSLHI